MENTMELIKQVQDDFDKVIKYSQKHIDHVNSDAFFSKWLEAKQYFIDAFGGKLIHQYPEKVSFSVSPEAQNSRISQFIEEDIGIWNNYDLCNFIERNRDGFFRNEIVKEQAISTDDGTVMLKPGMKLLRAFRYFEKDEETLNRIQQKASMLIQENKVEGYLCLSVHPLDFLSASENNHSWRSCHALDGEYRVGNLSYMMDKITVMCYLKSEEDVQLSAFPKDLLWNSKKWRMYLYLGDNHNALMASRQYPFFSNDALEKVKELLFTALQFSPSRWSPWYHDRISKYTHVSDTGQQLEYTHNLYLNYYPMNGRLYGDKDIIKDADYSHHYNDLLNSTCYTPWYCWRIDTSADIHFTLGGEMPCLICGRNHIDYTDRMMCYDCACDRGIGAEDLCTCDRCGREFDENQGHWVEDEYLCPDCYYEDTTECEMCGDRFCDEDMNYDEETDAYYCNYCYNRLIQDRRRRQEAETQNE